MKIVIIRHADPDYPNNTLTKLGFKEAEMLGKKYSSKDFDYFYCSSLPRAMLTCEAINKGKKPVEYCDWLQEVYFRINIDGQEQGNFDYDPEFFLTHKEYLDVDKYMSLPPFKGTQLEARYVEMCEKFDEVLAKHGYVRDGYVYKEVKPNDDTLVFVCHYGMMCFLVSHLINLPYNLLSQYICPMPSALTMLYSFKRNNKIMFRINCIGDRSHLGRKANISVNSYLDKNDRVKF